MGTTFPPSPDRLSHVGGQASSGYVPALTPSAQPLHAVLWYYRAIQSARNWWPSFPGGIWTKRANRPNGWCSGRRISKISRSIFQHRVLHGPSLPQPSLNLAADIQAGLFHTWRHEQRIRAALAQAAGVGRRLAMSGAQAIRCRAGLDVSAAAWAIYDR